MPSPRHHNEWLSLIEVSGPFLSVPVLERVFPQGLDPHDPEHTRLLKLAFEEWEDNQQGVRPNPAIHREWINFVLKQTLGLPDEVLAEGQDIPQTLRATIAEHGETLRPDVVVRNPEDGADAGKARLLIQTYPPTQDLEKPIIGRHWKASPATRMMELLHATDTRLGLVTNGNDWMLVDGPKGETTGFITWDATFWAEEPLTLRAFRSLLSVHRFFSVADDETLEAMLKESASNQQEVTDRLGYQVREAVEVIIRSLDRIDRDEKGQLLAGVSEPDLYEAALTVMMRMVFLFSADERGLLLLGDPLYDEHYAVSTLVARLQEAADQHGEEVLERRHDAWVRLLSTFRAVYGGVRHERLKLLPYAGRLFDPDRFPFLEGRRPGTTWKDTPATPLPIDNRTVLHLLRSLQYLEMQGEARRLSFRALDIEQIGHVYEGLLDHTTRRATEPMLSLTAARGDEPEVALSELERLRAKGEADLLRFLKEQTGRSENALKRALDTPAEGDAAKKFRAACGDERLLIRVRPFSGLVRSDTFGRPVVIRPDSVFVTAGTDRRSSGTHYTPRNLTEPIVQYTLEPLVYVGPVEGKPKEDWTLRPAGELLDLKICDMACGSGAFLVQACRYLSERLVEAWEDAEKRHPGVPGITPEGTASTGAANEQLIPRDTDERLAYARRLVTQRCLYGVDKNPLAVEMAKLSLWLLTLAKDKPFTFLDHAIRCGDSLIGISSEMQLKTFSLDGKGIDITLPNFLDMVSKIMQATRLLRVQLEKIADDTVSHVEEKRRLFENIRFQTKRLTYAADRLLAVSWGPAKPTERTKLLRQALQVVDDRIRDVDPNTLEAEGRAAREEVGCPQPFHWALEFPEVFLDRGGFDVIVGNPPFMGGLKLESELGRNYRAYIVDHIANNRKGIRGTADLCAYFFLRCSQVLRKNGDFGLVATNTIAQGDTHEVGLAQLVKSGLSIYRADKSLTWPGDATIEISKVWLKQGVWNGQAVLDGQTLSSISTHLTPMSDTQSEPHRLACNQNQCFIGSYVLGMGFTMSRSEAEVLIGQDPRNAEVLFPYINGIEFNSSPSQTEGRWIINFFDWPLEKAETYRRCIEIVRERVKPERDQLIGRNEMSTRRGTMWWRYAGEAKYLYQRIKGLNRVLARSRVSNLNSIAFLPSNMVFSDALVVFAYDDYAHFSVLQSAFHTVWLEQYCSTMRTDVRYTPGNAYDTFPICEALDNLERPGSEYYAHRRQIMLYRQEGLTKTYNRLHDPDESAAEVHTLRDLRVEMDKAVATAYGWSDLDLGHGFHETRQGLRFTISETARRKVLDLLLKLNHERYAEEVAEGLHDKKAAGGSVKAGGKKTGVWGGKSRASSGSTLPFGDDEVDPDPADGPDGDPSAGPERASSPPGRADRHVQRNRPAEPAPCPTPIDEIETDAIMAAFRQAARGRGWLERDELLKEVSLVLGYLRLSSKIEEVLRRHLRTAIRRLIIETDGPTLVRSGAATMADYEANELLEVFQSVMRKGIRYDREEVIPALARHLGFVRLTDTIREPIRKAITLAIRYGVLGYDRTVIWREE